MVSVNRKLPPVSEKADKFGFRKSDFVIIYDKYNRKEYVGRYVVDAANNGDWWTIGDAVLCEDSFEVTHWRPFKGKQTIE